MSGNNKAKIVEEDSKLRNELNKNGRRRRSTKE